RLFVAEEIRVGRSFPYADCALGNLVFAGSFLHAGRRFNAGVADYCTLLGVPPALVQNVTDGTNAFLVAVDEGGRLLASESEIVAAGGRHKIRDIALLDHEVTADERAALAGAPFERIEAFVRAHAVQPALNPQVLDLIHEADLIIYAPGTQHSSLLPSYLTPGLGAAIAANVRAIKLLVTNLQEDADTADASAVEIIGRAVHYLRDRSRLAIRTPRLISHYLLNDSQSGDAARPYVPLGRLEALEDPRLLRVANYEDGSSGRHDAKKVLGPFIENLVARPSRQRVVVWLVATASADKVCQTLLEAVRAGLDRLEPDLTVLYHSAESLDDDFGASMPCPVLNVATAGESADLSFRRATASLDADYVLLCDSSGMYRGEDLVNIALLLTNRRLDAVWGSRRLSVKDIGASYRERYRNHPLLGQVSYLGSHLLSLAYLFRFGRYVSDTLSGIRAVRTSFVLEAGGDPADPGFNHRLLTSLLGAKADLIETPVQFFPISTEIERRTTVGEGLRWLARLVTGR
ncbi:MAG TPA: 2-phospho-L-lactate transferase CofD family protein, partial [Vicinamibacterales bacterium]|nr:2-phospho-L-lactate transferase CofD family protein [Vicinamibacterales bacterium]